MKKCSVDGCEGKYYGKGYCRKHYMRVRKYGDPTVGDKCHYDMINTSEYTAWENMKNRCYNKNYAYYKNYGGRGITVCDRWRNSFVEFLSDMGKKPEQKMELYRTNKNGNYESNNCHWATHAENNRNKRDAVINMDIAREMRTKCAKGERTSDLAIEYNCSKSIVSSVVHNKTWKELDVKELLHL